MLVEENSYTYNYWENWGDIFRMQRNRKVSLVSEAMRMRWRAERYRADLEFVRAYLKKGMVQDAMAVIDSALEYDQERKVSLEKPYGEMEEILRESEHC